MEGPDAVAAVLAQLEGFEAPAGAWETEILPARINEYDPAWLDEQCLAGRFVWTRLARRRAEAGPAAGPVRAHADRAARPAAPARLGGARGPGRRRRAVIEAPAACWQHLGAHGASFFDEIVDGTGLLPTAGGGGTGGARRARPGQLRQLRRPARPAGALRATPIRHRPAPPPASALRHGFGRALGARAARANRHRRPHGRGRRWSSSLAGCCAAGGSSSGGCSRARRDWLPPWRELLFCYRRLEARGEIRGGRFVAGLSGEQFAAPEAVGLLREVRRRPRDGQCVSLSAADPLNLLGILPPGARLPALAGNRVLYRDGLPLATLAGGDVRVLETLDAATEWQVRGALLRRHVPAALADIG